LYVAGVENRSEHPVAKAIVVAAKAAGQDIAEPSDFKATAGHGVEGTVKKKKVLAGNEALMRERRIDFSILKKDIERLSAEGRTIVLVAVDDMAYGAVGLADTVKDGAAAAVRRLKEMGLDIILLSGDTKKAAEAIAEQVGIDRVAADVLPAEKETVVRKLQKEKRTVIMVGDGINDAPALAAADTGIAIGTGTDVAIEASDITLVGGDIGLVATAIALSRATMRKIKQNLFWAFFYNTALIPIAAGALIPLFGLRLDPVFGAGAMALSSVSVISNSLLLRRFRG